MRFQVPQFIEIEDKVVGPLTIKQFLYLAGGVGICFILYSFLPFILAIVFIAFIGALSVSLAFYKYNNKPFIDLLESGFQYYTGNKLYIWKKRERVPTLTLEKNTTPAQVYVPRLSESKLKELTWSLDINENTNPVTRELE